MSKQRSTVGLTLVLGTLTAFGPLSIDMYLPGLPRIAREFGVTAAQTQLTLSIFFVGMAAGQALYGPVCDRVGRKAPLAAGCVVYVLASLGCAFAPSITFLIGLRLLQALGGCAGIVIARSIVRDLFAERESARVYSFLTLVMGLAPVLAPLAGGQLLAVAGWRSIFLSLAGFGLGCLALVLVALPETLPEARRSRGGLGNVLRRYAELLADRRFVGYALAAGLIYAGMFAYIAGSPFVIIELYGVAPQDYGWIFGANALGLIAASQLNRRLLLRYSGDTILKAALASMMVAGLLLVLVAASGVGGLAGLLVPLFVCVAGVGLVGPNATAAAMAPYGRMAGSASALLGTGQFIVGAASSASVGALDNGSAVPMAAVIAGCACAAVAVYTVLVGRRASIPAADVSAALHNPEEQI